MAQLFKNKSLATRILGSMILLIFISLIVIGTFTMFFFKNENDVYHLGRLQRKELSVVLALNYFVVNNKIKEADEAIYQKLDELATINSLDFNLYNEFGGRVHTTIHDEDSLFLSPPQMEQSLISQVLESEEALVVDEEIAGEAYLSSYFVLKGYNDAPVALVHIPYHKDVKRSREEQRAFLNTLIQVFIVLFVGASFIAYFLSNYITKSLAAVTEGIKRTRLDGETPHIEWTSDDEIGALVKNYNRMVDELQHSAELLAKSQRESAWKEMARQVAHEIKNPLTPMRLNIQHLQRTVTDDPERIQERLDQFAKLMIEQIDTLSRIANEFSNFAQMPKPEIATVNLDHTLQQVADLYGSTPQVDVMYENKVNDYVEVQADQKQLMRCISNLVKNAIQSIPSGKMGKVVIEMLRNPQGKLVVNVVDNGKGINPAEQHKIFEPYFTTKSGGTGLGLAMVKNMLNEFGAEISFTSAEGQGTCFTITFSA
jgi:signal transduction histidine kinase